MNKAIKIALLVYFIFIAQFACTQTVASDSNGLFLRNNSNSSKAQSYINATETKPQAKTASDFSTNNNSLKDISNSATISNKSAADFNAPSTTKPASYSDDGSLPLFSKLQASNTRSITTINEGSDPTFSLITSLLGLIIIALAASWFIQKKAGFSANNFGKVLGIVPLDNKRLIYVVDVMGKVMVLGVTENNINFLTEITDKDTIDAYRLRYGQSVTPGLEKLFPFIKSSDSNHEDDQEKMSQQTANKKIESVKTELDNNKKIRNTRIQNMLIKK